MFLEIANNNGTKYIRICETVRVPDQKTGKSKPVKKTIKNIGPVTRFDDGKPDFISRLKSSFAAGQPILDELKPYVVERCLRKSTISGWSKGQMTVLRIPGWLPIFYLRRFLRSLICLSSYALTKPITTFISMCTAL